ncbi:MAG: ACT domain-containing protein [Planctomycetes bacterium]|nr:ACT domain-containing protein [Planctomycetota bacterium]
MPPALPVGLAPELQPGTYAFVSVAHGASLEGLDAIATMREAEGLTVVLPLARAVERGLAVAAEFAWITLATPTELTAIGVTAAFAGALANAGIPCNVIAGVRHDHVFVPSAAADRAVGLLGEVEWPRSS